MARLRIDGLSRNFGAFKALDDVSMDIADSELLAVLGPSGCGKTTLLRAIAGFDIVSAGSIAIGEQVVSSPSVHVPPEERRVGIVFQSYALWPHMTVAQNVGYALKVAKVPPNERQRRVEDALKLVGLEGFDTRAPSMLSGGQRQRVALARCLVMTPSLVLLDEPLANLDVHLRSAMEAEFATFHRRTGTTMIYITHDQSEAMALADRIAVLDRGRLLQLASPHVLYREPSSETVARFVGEGMIVPARIQSHKGKGHAVASIAGIDVTIRTNGGGNGLEQGKVCLRPRDLRLAQAGESALDARVLRAIYQGGYYRVEAAADKLPGEVLRLDVPDGARFNTGDHINLGISDGWLLPEVSSK